MTWLIWSLWNPPKRTGTNFPQLFRYAAAIPTHLVKQNGSAPPAGNNGQIFLKVHIFLLIENTLNTE